MSLLQTRLAIGGNLAYTTLDGGINDSVTSIAVSSGSIFQELSASANRRRWIPAVIVDAASPGEVTFGDLESGEHIAITDHVADSTTITVIRGDNPVSHGDGALIMVVPTAQVWESIYTKQRTIEAGLVLSMGGGDGAGILNSGATDQSAFAATESDPPDMTVTVAGGICWYDHDLQWKETAEGFEFVAPAESTRVDVICAYPLENRLLVVAGTEGAGAPAVPTNYVPLWNVTIRVGATSIKATDDATNGYFTDAPRPFA